MKGRIFQTILATLSLVLTFGCDNVQGTADETRRWSNQYQQLESAYVVNPKNNYPGNTGISTNPFSGSTAIPDSGVSIKMLFPTEIQPDC